jgi:hypothetical protein
MRDAGRGLLGRRPVRAARAKYIGKESNSLEDAKAGRISDLADVLNEYRRKGFEWPDSVQWVLRRVPKSVLARRTGLSSRTIAAARNGRVPHQGNRNVLVLAAGEFAREGLRRSHISPPSDPVDACEILQSLDLSPVSGI